MDAQQADFIANRSWTVHRLLFHIMSHGAPVHATVRVEDLGAATGPILVINPHLLPPLEMEAVDRYAGGPIVMIGPEDASKPSPLWCRVRGETGIVDEVEAELPEDVMGIEEPYGYWDHMEFGPASDGFLRQCADTIVAATGVFTVLDEAEDVCLMVTEKSDGALRIAIKSTSPFYAKPMVEMAKPVESVDIVTSFPSVSVQPEGNCFAVRVPPRGVTVVDVRLRE